MIRKSRTPRDKTLERLSPVRLETHGLLLMAALLFVPVLRAGGGDHRVSAGIADRTDNFVSQTGFYFPLPAGYQADSRVGDDNPDVEIIILFRDSTAEKVWENPNRLESGAMVIESVPLLESEQKDASYRKRLDKQLKQTIKDHRWVAATRWFKSLPLEGLALKASKPKHVRVYLFGKTHLYKVMGQDWDTPFDRVVRGFHEQK